jgi:hypothetical protein
MTSSSFSTSNIPLSISPITAHKEMSIPTIYLIDVVSYGLIISLFCFVCVLFGSLHQSSLSSFLVQHTRIIGDVNQCYNPHKNPQGMAHLPSCSFDCLPVAPSSLFALSLSALRDAFDCTLQ